MAIGCLDFQRGDRSLAAILLFDFVWPARYDCQHFIVWNETTNKDTRYDALMRDVIWNVPLVGDADYEWDLDSTLSVVNNGSINPNGKSAWFFLITVEYCVPATIAGAERSFFACCTEKSRVCGDCGRAPLTLFKRLEKVSTPSSLLLIGGENRRSRILISMYPMLPAQT